jgi:23S rRNA (adenine2503-C2)-methyltransferase
LETLQVPGRTFAEVVERLQPRPHEVAGLRDIYRALLAGQTPDASQLRKWEDRGFALHADIAPVVAELHEADLTKYVQRLHDGLEVECVVVPMQRSRGGWETLCVSSQVGCARACVFCETGQMGLLRNLTPAEIIGQVVAAQRQHGQRVRNVVFMGMGEPFDNIDNLFQALHILRDRNGLSFGAERLTVSTVGRVAGIRRLARLGWRRINLAVSLNAPNDEIRSAIMPHNRLEPLAVLREALLEYPLRRCQFFMIEYVLIPGVNDAYEHAVQLREFLRPVKGVVNVIPYNPRHHSPWPAPTEESVVQFLAWLESLGQICKRRLTKGRAQMAACGQLGNRALAGLPIIRNPGSSGSRKPVM